MLCQLRTLWSGGGDFGAGVATLMALDRPDPIIGIHLSTVVSFLSMNQMMMKIERIVRLHLAFVCRRRVKNDDSEK